MCVDAQTDLSPECPRALQELKAIAANKSTPAAYDLPHADALAARFHRRDLRRRAGAVGGEPDPRGEDPPRVLRRRGFGPAAHPQVASYETGGGVLRAARRSFRPARQRR